MHWKAFHELPYLVTLYHFCKEQISEMHQDQERDRPSADPLSDLEFVGNAGSSPIMTGADVKT